MSWWLLHVVPTYYFGMDIIYIFGSWFLLKSHLDFDRISRKKQRLDKRHIIKRRQFSKENIDKPITIGEW
jgi:hypothetical protein